MLWELMCSSSDDGKKAFIYTHLLGKREWIDQLDRIAQNRHQYISI